MGAVCLTDNLMYQRLKKVLKPMVILMAVGFLYITLQYFTGFYIPCPFHFLTGLYCAGCGITRMFLYILKGEWIKAFSSNCVVFCLLPFFGVGYLCHVYRYVRWNKKGLSKTENILCYIVIVLLILFGIIRNIFPTDILIP